MGELRPDEAADPAEFVDLLRRLKDRSGLTYRQLEQRAAAAGDVLARSTAADVLRRSTLPRPEVLAAFVCACGAQDQVDVWLRARDRLATGAYGVPSSAVPASAVPASTGNAPGGWASVRNWGRSAPVLWTLLVVGTLLAAFGVGTWFWWPADRQQPPSADAGAVTTPGRGASAAPSGGRSQIRPARTPQLCLSEGRDRTGRYPHEVAVQRPCAHATPPDTYLQPVADDLYFIKWDHPERGPGCLTVRRDDPGRYLIEPWGHCRTDFWPQLFRFESTGSPPSAYRIRPAGSDLCLGIRDDDTEALAEAVTEPCTGGADQVFLIDPLP